MKMAVLGTLSLPIKDLENGLSLQEVVKRRQESGFNEIIEPSVSYAKIFLKRFWGLTPYLLEFTIILEFILKEYLEAYLILGLLVFNAIVGFLQEKKANSALSSLKEKLNINAKVKRDKQWFKVPARELVPGDLVRLRAGDFVPADIKIVEGVVDVDQSSITGESLSIQRVINDTLYSGSKIKWGEISGIVTNIGAKTYFGRTIELVSIAKPKLHIETIISKIVKWLFLIVGIAIIVVIILAIIRGIDLLLILPLIVILLVSTVPVALPTMFTISMAIGSLALIKKGVLITRLDATEDAATMDVLCADKTGTITQNILFLTETIAAPGYTQEDVIMNGALASNESNQDSIDLAFLRAAKSHQIHLNEYKQSNFIPFDPSTRKTEAFIEVGKDSFSVFKGATRQIFNMCKINQEDLSIIEKNVEYLSKRGYRFIAVAKGTTHDDIRLVGVAALYDKLRDDTPKFIEELTDLGINLKILTGDALLIANQVANQLHLKGDIIRIGDIKQAVKEEKETHRLETSAGFAEIYPEDKYLIVENLQNRGHIVGMTGDGINDAPALKQAEVGIAVSSATDVAKQASSVVLTKEGLEGIIDVVKMGRSIYQRISTWITNKMVRTFKRSIFIVVAFIIFNIFIVSAFEIVLLLFLSDYVTLALATDNVRYSKKPETWNIANKIKVGAILGVLNMIEAIIMLILGFSIFGFRDNVNHIHTFVLISLVITDYLTVLSLRERKHFWNSRPSKVMILVILANSIFIILVSVLGIPGIYPISMIEIGFVIAYSLVTCLLLNDFLKYFLNKKYDLII